MSSFFSVVCLWFLFLVHVSMFFFFKQKTAYEMRISDWSSDVCSSDLVAAVHREVLIAALVAEREVHPTRLEWQPAEVEFHVEIGRASCRERVCSTCRSRW